jgi:hypothetical protein
MVERYLPFVHPKAKSEAEDLVAALSYLSEGIVREYDVACEAAVRQRAQVVIASGVAGVWTLVAIAWAAVSASGVAAILAMLSSLVFLGLCLALWRLSSVAEWVAPRVVDVARLWWKVVIYPVDEGRAVWWDTLERERLNLRVASVPLIPPQLNHNHPLALDQSLSEAGLLALLAELLEMPGRAINEVSLPFHPSPQQARYFQALARLWPVLRPIPESWEEPLPTIPGRDDEGWAAAQSRLLAETCRDLPHQRVELRRWRGSVIHFASRAASEIRRVQLAEVAHEFEGAPRPHPFDPIALLAEHLRPLHQTVAAEMVPVLEKEVRQLEYEREQLLVRLRRDFDLDRRRIERDHQSQVSGNEALARRHEMLVAEAQKNLLQAEAALKQNQNTQAALAQRCKVLEPRLGQLAKEEASNTSMELPAQKELASLRDQEQKFRQEIARLELEEPRLRDRVSDRQSALQAEQAALARLELARHEADAAFRQELARLETSLGEAEDRETVHLDAQLAPLQADLTYFRRMVPALLTTVAGPLSSVRYRPLDEEEGYRQLRGLERELVHHKATALQQWSEEMLSRLDTLGNTIENTRARIEQISVPMQLPKGREEQAQPLVFFLPVWRVNVAPGRVPSLRPAGEIRWQPRLITPLFARQGKQVLPIPVLQQHLETRALAPTPEQEAAWEKASLRWVFPRTLLQEAAGRQRRPLAVSEFLEESLQALATDDE